MIGLAAGAYEKCLGYVLERKQFGKKLAGFQIIQEKLSRMLGQIEMMLAMVVIMSQNYDNNVYRSNGQISRLKAMSSKMAREVIQTARECMGGNGILAENRVMKHLIDIEAMSTGEGTYDINMLVSGREITGGINAFI